MFKTIGFILYFVLFLSGVFLYEGSWQVYTFFTIVFFLVFISIFVKKNPYFYIFLAGMLWLGFWFKFTVHLIFNYPWVEQIGGFIENGESYDDVLIVASIGAMGLMLGWVITLFLAKKLNFYNYKNTFFSPSWYPVFRPYILTFLIFSILFFSVSNMFFSFHQTGLVAETQIWPLNTLYFWLLSIGFSIAVCSVLLYEFSINRPGKSVFYLLILEGGMSSVSLMSRGIYLFHTLPALFAVYKNRKVINNKVCITVADVLVYFSVFLFFFFIVYISSNMLRDIYYKGVSFEGLLHHSSKLLSDSEGLVHHFSKLLSDFEGVINFFQADSSLRDAILKFFSFSVDRWLGMEGVMAVDSYVDKSWHLFSTAFWERAEVGKSNVYQYIAMSHYVDTDLTKFQFMTIPGIIGFLYFTGSLSFVFFATAFIVFLLFMLEFAVLYLTRNFILASVLGFMFANMIAQAGVAPLDKIFVLILTFISLIFIHVLTVRANFFLSKRST